MSKQKISLFVVQDREGLWCLVLNAPTCHVIGPSHAQVHRAVADADVARTITLKGMGDRFISEERFNWPG